MGVFAIFALLYDLYFGEDAQMMRDQTLVQRHVHTQFRNGQLGMLVQKLNDAQTVRLIQTIEHLKGVFYIFVTEHFER